MNKGQITSVAGEKNIAVDIDLNKNRALKVSKSLQEQYKSGFGAFAPLKSKDGKSAPISAYFELIVKYPELIGNGVDPTFFNLAKEALEYKKSGATEAQINARYKMSVKRI